jgi:hypothetical protein
MISELKPALTAEHADGVAGQVPVIPPQVPAIALEEEPGVGSPTALRQAANSMAEDHVSNWGTQMYT